MRYVTYASDNGPRAGILVEDAVVDADTALREAQLGDRVNGAPTTRRLLGLAPAHRAALGAAAEVAADRGDALDAGDVTLHAPVTDPGEDRLPRPQLPRPRAESGLALPPAPLLFREVPATR